MTERSRKGGSSRADAVLELPPLKPPEKLDSAGLGRTLVLVPHPDDETIGCGGLIAALSDAGQPLCVVLVSDGSGAGELPEGTAAIRQQEFHAAMGELAPGSVLENWELPDGSLDHVEDLVPRVSDAIARFQADTLVTTWLRDMHPDHSVLGRAALQAWRGSPDLRRLLFYEAWTPLDANRILEVTQQWPRKQRALACHRTALQAQNYERSMEGLARHRALLLPGIRAGDTIRYAEAYHLLETDRGRVGPGARFLTRPARQDDAERIRRLFETVFDTPVDQRWWDWKYRDPDWIGTVAEKDDGELAGFYGVLPRMACWRGERLPVCQMVDSMVAPNGRRASRRSGAFLEMCMRFLSPHVGDGKPFALAYGYPNERAMKAGERLGVYQRGEETFCWSRPAQPWSRQPGPSRPWHRLVWRARTTPVESVEDLRWMDPLFPAMQSALPDTLLLERSAGYWLWRFRQNPQCSYQFLQVRRLGRIVAGGVLRRRDDEDSLELVDAVFADRRAFHALVKAAEHRAWSSGLSRFLIWGTAHLMANLPPGETVREGSVAWPDAQFGASFVPEVRGRFWALGGDTDFR